VAILNMDKSRAYIGKAMGREKPISERTWALLREQGVPVGRIGNSEFCSSEALDKWLEARAATPFQASMNPVPTPNVPAGPQPQRRGRPKKHPIFSSLQPSPAF
jgi:hypothetical protein